MRLSRIAPQLWLTTLLAGCSRTPPPAAVDLPRPPEASQPLELYGDGGIRPAEGISEVSWGPGGTVVIASERTPVVARDGATWIAWIDPRKGTTLDFVDAPCPQPTVASSPEFPLIAVQCTRLIDVIDPTTGRVTVLDADPTYKEGTPWRLRHHTSVQVGDYLARLETQPQGTTLALYDATLSRTSERTLPFAPSEWTIGRSLVAAVSEVAAGTTSAALVWYTPTAQGSALVDGVTTVDAVVTDGRRVVVESGANLRWLDTATGVWTVTTVPSEPAVFGYLGPHSLPRLGFVGDVLWVSVLGGWMRFSGPDQELSMVTSQLNGQVAVASSAGMLIADVAAAVAWAPDGRPMMRPPPWLALSGVGLAADGGSLVAVTGVGVTVVDRSSKAVKAWWDGAEQAWLSADGRWLAESAGVRLWFREVASGRTVEARSVPLPPRERVIEGPGWAVHGGWASAVTGSAPGRFVGIWRAWSHATVMSWRPDQGDPIGAELVGGLSGGRYLAEEMWVVSPDGRQVMTNGGAGFRVVAVDASPLRPVAVAPEWTVAASAVATHGAGDREQSGAVAADGSVVALLCYVHYPDGITGRTYHCSRAMLPDGAVASYPVAGDARLSADGSVVFAGNGDLPRHDHSTVSVYSASGALLRVVPVAGPGQWPDFNPWADGAFANRAMVYPLADGRVQVIDAG